MTSASDKKSLLIIFAVIAFVITGTTVATYFARGYKLNIEQGTIQATGLISLTSLPKGASVYLNDRLVTATDDNLSLIPGEYQIKIVKDGFIPWQKTYQVKKEIVFQTNANLFRSVPELLPITLSGAINPTASPDKSQLVFAVASASASKDNGLFVIGLNDPLIPLSRSLPKQLAINASNIDWSKASFKFSPNGRQILATFSNANYLINLDSSVNSNTLFDVTARIPLINSDWQKQDQEIVQKNLDRLPEVLKDYVATDSSKLISFNQADDKVFYLANKSGLLLPSAITPPPAQSTQNQDRNIVAGNYYVYDLKDFTNYLIGNQQSISELSWLPNSNNLIFVEDNSIKACDYDHTNRATIFSGNFKKDLVTPWADGSKIITLTEAYPGASQNLYSISLK
ncbi:MAG TPA: PEGA domain-containing protein [Candidatus Woesebacteria bacterium]|nr:PEGA domain-containing protein [Candidatus Woesebacteria bacterium]HPJ17290.1 PEGA domain-containing protein [Candidatus Woesebacteria bacterium]